MTEGKKGKTQKEMDPKKGILSVAEREKQFLDRVPKVDREDLGKLVQEYWDIFPEKRPNCVTPSWRV